MAWSHDCHEGWNVHFGFEEGFLFKLFNRMTIKKLLYKPKQGKQNKTQLIVTTKKTFVSQSQHLFSARGMSSTRAGLPRYIKTPVIPNWISPHVDSTVQQAAVFGPHIGILDSFALLLLLVHCSASLHKSESKSEAKRMSHYSPSLIWYGHVVPMLAGGCWWGKCWGLVAGRASKPRSLAARCQLMIDRLLGPGGREGATGGCRRPTAAAFTTHSGLRCWTMHICTLLRLLQTMLWRQHHNKLKNTLLLALLD